MLKIVNVETGEVIEREMNKTEKEQQKLDIKAAEKSIADMKAKETAKQAILDRIGLTADELKTILG
jgi:hypothetical protein